jgi:hypothetical protein
MLFSKLKAILVGYLIAIAILGFRMPSVAHAGPKSTASVEVSLGGVSYRVSSDDLAQAAANAFATTDFAMAVDGERGAAFHYASSQGLVTFEGRRASFGFGAIELDSNGQVARVSIEDPAGDLARLVGDLPPTKIAPIIVIIIIIILIILPKSASIVISGPGVGGGGGPGAGALSGAGAYLAS